MANRTLNDIRVRPTGSREPGTTCGRAFRWCKRARTHTSPSLTSVAATSSHLLLRSPPLNMPIFKAPVTQSDRRKTKGDWVIKNQQRAVVTGKGRLFALPPELRNRIYEYIFTPGTVIGLRKSRESLKCVDTIEKPNPQYDTSVYCGRQMGKYTRYDGSQTNWARSVSGLIHANKQAYRECVKLLYKNSVFMFEPIYIGQSFLRTVERSNLESIRLISIVHEFHGHGNLQEAALQKQRADASFAKFCRQVARCIPNIITLYLNLKLKGELETIVPDFSTPQVTYSAQHLESISWIQPLKAFTSLKSLNSASVVYPTPSPESLESLFDRSNNAAALPNHATLHPLQIQLVAKSWALWCTWLYHSLATAIEDMLLGKADFWDEHLKVLHGYQKWRFDPFTPVEKYLPKVALVKTIMGRSPRIRQAFAKVDGAE